MNLRASSHLTLRPLQVQQPALDRCESRGGRPVVVVVDVRSRAEGEGLESRGASGCRARLALEEPASP